jgi:hypothetical protein
MPRIALNSNRENGEAMSQITMLEKFRIPLGNQEIELQQIDHVDGGLSLMRIRIREGRRFTIFDVDPATARHWGCAMQAWAEAQTSNE